MVRTRSRRGLTLLEVAFTVGILSGLLLVTFTVLVRSREAVGLSRLQKLARIAAESQVEEVRAQCFEPAAFAALPGGATNGQTFTVAGLPRRVDGQPHGLVELFMDESAANPVTLQALDLNGDGDTSDTTLADMDGSGTPASLEFRVVPVRVTVRWGQDGVYVLRTVLSQPQNFNRQTG